MTFPSEWHRQEFVQLTWPNEDTDWAPVIDDAYECYYHIAREIASRLPLLIVAADVFQVKHLIESGIDGRIDADSRMRQEDMHRIHYCECPINDTWARDHAFISLLDKGERVLMDYCFNGWGKKFAATLDNQINATLHRSSTVKGKYISCLDFVLEGGSIESDGRGTLLTTASCLLAPNRNEPLTRQDIEARLLSDLHADRLLWLEHGYLAGDDTDGHVDTLARLCPQDTICYVQCTDESDEHYTELSLMEQELQAFHTAEGGKYRLIPLPMPEAIYDEDGERLPATYANFLVTNGAVLYPTYDQPSLDAKAKAQLQLAFPEHDIVGIDCRVLIKQHGSLHCCTMQYPVTD